jgi:hypothetical protein
MRARIPPLQQAPPLPCVPIKGRLRMRTAEANEVSHVLHMSAQRHPVQRQLERREDPAQGRIRPGARTWTPESPDERLCL